MEIGTARCCFDTLVPCFSHSLTALRSENFHKLPSNASAWSLRTRSLSGRSLAYSHVASAGKNRKELVFWRTHSMPVNVEEFPPSQSEDQWSGDEDSNEDELLSKPLSSEELKSILVDSERQKLVKKLSEANQHNRHLKRQLHVTEDALVKFKSELAVMELEIQALVRLAEEIAQYGIPERSRMINGKFIQSHLLSRLEVIHEKLKEQIKDVDAAQSKEVSLFWCGMAESVQVMGTFDGWSQGEHLSPEYDGSFTKFSTKLMLRPGRYEIKFVVDGMWQLSPEFPTVGEGLTKNNLLIVE